MLEALTLTCLLIFLLHGRGMSNVLGRILVIHPSDPKNQTFISVIHKQCSAVNQFYCALFMTKMQTVYGSTRHTIIV